MVNLVCIPTQERGNEGSSVVVSKMKITELASIKQHYHLPLSLVPTLPRGNAYLREVGYGS